MRRDASYESTSRAYREVRLRGICYTSSQFLSREISSWVKCDVWDSAFAESLKQPTTEASEAARGSNTDSFPGRTTGRPLRKCSVAYALRMAIVISFREMVKERVGRAKPTECGYAFVELDGVPYLLLESYGSPERRKPGKTSQSFHLDRDRAAELKRVLERTFPGI